MGLRRLLARIPPLTLPSSSLKSCSSQFWKLFFFAYRAIS
ncbi:unnamed protein product [Brugia timori]|uniref:Uncharacterized protein n=1 Tax=Brugia timori TaxID=42155 RepID=A0A0R3QHY4_9BILA|nr:unnamed protein product [Brugia timori]